MSISLLPQDIRDEYEIAERHHACAILKNDFSSEWNDLMDVLRHFRLRKLSRALLLFSVSADRFLSFGRGCLSGTFRNELG